MEKLGKKIDHKEVSQIIAKHDKTGDAMVDFAEFKEIFFNAEDEAENARVK